MSILDATRQLGTEIQKDERFIAFAKAKLALDSDTELQNAIGEFNMTRMNLEQENSNETPDENKVNELNEKLREIYGKVMASSVMMDFNSAKSAVDSMLNDINSVIMQCVEGADPDTCEPEKHDCTGSCATCGGCH